MLAGVLPADLEVMRAGTVSTEGAGMVGSVRRAFKKAVLERVLRLWQDRWHAERRGSDLYKVFPDVAARLEMTHVEVDHQLSQILTGHGCFRGRLRDMKLRESGACDCGEADEYRDHVLWECRLYEGERAVLLDSVTRGPEEGPVYYEDLDSTKGNFVHLKRYAHSWFRRRSLVL